MRAAVTRDTTTRTIFLEVAGAPDVDVTRAYHRKPRILRPQKAIIQIVDGKTLDLKVTGGLVLKSGAASTDVKENYAWHREGSWGTGESIDKAPDWVRLLWNEAPQGVTTWRTGADAGEVQAL